MRRIVRSGARARSRSPNAPDSLRLRALDVRDRLRGRARPLVPPRRLRLRRPRATSSTTGDEFLGALRRARRPAARPRACSTSAAASAGWPARWPATSTPRGLLRRASTSTATGIGWCRRALPRATRNFRFQRRRPLQPRATTRAARTRPPSTASPTTTRASTSSSRPRSSPTCSRTRPSTTSPRPRACSRPAAALLATFFLLDDDVARGDRRRARAALPFLDPDEHVAVRQRGRARGGRRLRPRLGRRGAARHGLDARRVHAGHWRGARRRSTFQDIVVRRSAMSAADRRPPPRARARHLLPRARRRARRPGPESSRRRRCSPRSATSAAARSC